MLGLIIPLSHITFFNIFFNVCLQTSGDYSHIPYLNVDDEDNNNNNNINNNNNNNNNK